MPGFVVRIDRLQRRRLALLRIPLFWVLLVVAAACTNGEQSILDQGPRIPDDEGVATDMTLDRIELEGERRYEIAPNVESFKTRSHEITSLLGMERRYVHVGLNDEGQVAWIAAIGAVTQSDPPRVVYVGRFTGIDEETGRAVFDDGTTLALADDVAAPRQREVEVVVTIDPRARLATSIEAATARRVRVPQESPTG